jgi:hypothetical protein
LLAVAANCTANVRFKASTAGFPVGNLNFPFIEIPPLNVPISGQDVGGVLAPVVSWYPSFWSYDFGTVGVGSSVNKILTITNNGQAPVAFCVASPMQGCIPWDIRPQESIVTDIAISGNQCNLTLQPGDSCNVTITFAPQKNETLVPNGAFLTWYCMFCQNDLVISANGLYFVNFSGVGIYTQSTPESMKPKIASNYSSFDFGSVPNGAFKDQLITVTNIGLINTNAVVSLTGDPAFSIITNFCGNLTPTTICGFTIRYQPTGGGSQSGSVTIDGGYQAQITIPITGNSP